MNGGFDGDTTERDRQTETIWPGCGHNASPACGKCCDALAAEVREQIESAARIDVAWDALTAERDAFAEEGDAIEARLRKAAGDPPCDEPIDVLVAERMKAAEAEVKSLKGRIAEFIDGENGK